MPTLIAFDTAAAHCAAVLVRDGEIAERALVPMVRGQAEALFPLLGGMLDRAGLDWERIDALGVGIGPGNFTGIRIAVAAARGLAFALRRPAIGITGFELLRGCVPAIAGPVLACLPASRDQIHAELTGMPGAPVHLVLAPGDPTRPPAVPADTTIVGPGADVLGSVLGLEAVEVRIDDLPGALGRAVADRFAAGGDWPRPAPLYARAADAAPPREAAPAIVS